MSLKNQLDNLTQQPVLVVLFARMSSEVQDFGRQLRDLEHHATRAGYQVVATIAEKLLGSRRSRAKRPDLADVKQIEQGRFEHVAGLASVGVQTLSDFARVGPDK